MSFNADMIDRHRVDIWCSVVFLISLPIIFLGKENGLSLLIDTESYDHGFKGSPGAGVSLLLHHHGDQPVMGSGSIRHFYNFLGTRVLRVSTVVYVSIASSKIG